MCFGVSRSVMSMGWSPMKGLKREGVQSLMSLSLSFLQKSFCLLVGVGLSFWCVSNWKLAHSISVQSVCNLLAIQAFDHELPPLSLFIFVQFMSKAVENDVIVKNQGKKLARCFHSTLRQQFILHLFEKARLKQH